MFLAPLFTRRAAHALGAICLSGLCVAASHAQANITTIASFTGIYSNGANPYGSVTLDGSGNLYGTTFSGGTAGNGTVFRIDKGSSTVTTIASFSGSNGTSYGANPFAGVTLDSDGNIFGTTTAGVSASTYGTVYEIAKGSTKINTIASFNKTNGASPYAGVTFDGSGNLFGTTASGGTNNLGTVYEILKGTSTINTIASFAGSNGSNPSALIFDSSGNLYGTTRAGTGNSIGGTIFEIAKGTTTISTLAFFAAEAARSGLIQGSGPTAGVTLDGSGNLFGTTYDGGRAGVGTVFELVKGSSAVTILSSFDDYNGAGPYGGVAIDGAGNLFGATRSASNGNAFGSVYKIASGSKTIQVLGYFYGNNGADPYGTVILDSSGNLFGTTQSGGAPGRGNVFGLAGVGSPFPAPVPEASSVISLGLLLCLGGVCLAVRKRTKPAA